MCLTTQWPPEKLAKLQERARTNPIIGLKIVTMDHYRRLTGFNGFKFKTGYAINSAGRRAPHIKGTTWTRNKRISIEYPRGFHAYALKDFNKLFVGNENSRIIRVALWDIVAAGKQNDKTVYVARKMMLLC